MLEFERYGYQSTSTASRMTINLSSPAHFAAVTCSKTVAACARPTVIFEYDLRPHDLEFGCRPRVVLQWWYRVMVAFTELSRCHVVYIPFQLWISEARGWSSVSEFHLDPYFSADYDSWKSRQDAKARISLPAWQLSSNLIITASSGKDLHEPQWPGNFTTHSGRSQFLVFTHDPSPVTCRLAHSQSQTQLHAINNTERKTLVEEYYIHGYDVPTRLY